MITFVCVHVCVCGCVSDCVCVFEYMLCGSVAVSLGASRVEAVGQFGVKTTNCFIMRQTKGKHSHTLTHTHKAKCHTHTDTCPYAGEGAWHSSISRLKQSQRAVIAFRVERHFEAQSHN